MEVIPIRHFSRRKQRLGSIPIFFLRTSFLRPFMRKLSSQTRRCASTKPRCIFIKLFIPNFKARISLLKTHFRGSDRAQQRSVGRTSRVYESAYGNLSRLLSVDGQHGNKSTTKASDLNDDVEM